MAFINISSVYTADPGDIWTPKNSFMLHDPFAIALNIQADSSLVDEGLLFDAVFQIIGPQQDAHGFAWWTIVNVGNAKQGVFYVQGTVNVQGSNLFANSGQFWFKVRA